MLNPLARATEIGRLNTKLRAYEAVIAAVAVQAADWAALADPAGWSLSDHDAVLADCGRQLQRLMAQPPAASERDTSKEQPR